MWKNSVSREFDENISFSTESAKNPSIYDFLFLNAIYSPKNDNNYLSKIRTKIFNLQ